jgi:hypothetical protein
MAHGRHTHGSQSSNQKLYFSESKKKKKPKKNSIFSLRLRITYWENVYARDDGGRGRASREGVFFSFYKIFPFGELKRRRGKEITRQK